jgi:hypothetical protein
MIEAHSRNTSGPHCTRGRREEQHSEIAELHLGKLLVFTQYI